MVKEIKSRAEFLEIEQLPTEKIAQAVISISEAFERIEKGTLNRRALVVLLKDSIKGKMAKKEIESVLDGLKKLKDIYVKKGT